MKRARNRGRSRNRATITGAIEIGRHPGVVQVTFRAPLEKLDRAGLLPLVSEYYGINGLSAMTSCFR